jgi:hypothetical protein
MVSPFVVSVGTPAAAPSGSITPGLPPGYTLNDILLIFVDTAQDTVAGAPTGYAQLGPDNGAGATHDVAGATRLTVFWKRSSAAETAPTVTNVTGVIYGVMMAVRGCRIYGDPFFVVSQFVKSVASTAYSSQTGNGESIDDSLIVYGLSNGISNTTAQLSNLVNATLTNLTKQFDDTTTDGVGGGLAIVTGNLATAGPIGTLTGTWATSTADVTNAFAMIPNTAIDIVASPRTAEVQVFYPNAGGGVSTWIKPFGAKWIDITAIGAGGGGGNGRSSATASTGGAGGGGGFRNKRIPANTFGASLNVGVGFGGAGGANAAAGGNNGAAGAVSLVQDPATAFSLVQAVGGNGGDGAVSGGFGLGGGGGGFGNPTPAAQGTQGFGGQGGGNGATGGAGGYSDQGGGGGGGGGTTPALFVGGNSAYGGGGGGGGGTTTAGGGGNGGGGSGGGVGSAGSNSPYLTLGGGGGGGASTATAPAGSGGFPGGGGGGGSESGTNTAGGSGGGGVVVIVTTF